VAVHFQDGRCGLEQIRSCLHCAPGVGTSWAHSSGGHLSELALKYGLDGTARATWVGYAGSATSSTRDYVLCRSSSAHRLRRVQHSNAVTLCHYARIVTKGNRPGIMSSLKRPIRINGSARCLSSLQDNMHFFFIMPMQPKCTARETGHGVWPQGDGCIQKEMRIPRE